MPSSRRPYRSSLRAEQARATRRAVVEAARDLYIERGYAGATIDAVAERAGVSRKTVFTAAGGKAEMLKLAWDWALVGDDEPVAMIDRPAVQEMIAERDPARLLAGWARHVTAVAGRVADLHPVLTTAATSDPDIAALNDVSERNMLIGATGFVTGLAALGALREGWTVERAAQAATVLFDSWAYRRLVLHGGWTTDDYVEWVIGVAKGTFADVD
jgi:AcrR family transcriptional regulator